MPEGQTVCDDLDASLVSDRNVEVHVGELDVSCDPGASFAADPRNGVLHTPFTITTTTTATAYHDDDLNMLHDAAPPAPSLRGP